MLIAIGIYTGLLATPLNVFLLGSGKPIDRAIIVAMAVLPNALKLVTRHAVTF